MPESTDLAGLKGHCKNPVLINCSEELNSFLNNSLLLLGIAVTRVQQNITSRNHNMLCPKLRDKK